MEEDMCNYLTKRGSTYYFRRKVPNDLVELLNKREIIYSLKTKNRTEAVQASHKHSVETDELFASAREKIESSLILDTAPKWIPAPTTELFKKDNVSAQLSINGDLNALINYFIQRFRVWRAGHEEGFSASYNEALRTLHESSQYFIKTGEADVSYGYNFIEAEAIVHAINYLLDHIPTPTFPAHYAPNSTPAPRSYATSAEGPTLLEVVDKWRVERNPVERTYRHVKKVTQLFSDITTKTKIEDCTKADVVKFKDELILKSFSVSNANNYLSLLSTIFSYGHNQAYISTNPASGVRIKQTTSSKAARLPFDTIALKKIFNSPIYLENFRPAGGKGEAAYWLPLLALYTGARLEELCQLRTNDILQEDYIHQGVNLNAWVIHITDEGEGQRLKNTNSKRKIPLHHDLIDRGFITFVQSQQSGFIFNELKPTKEFGQRGGNWSKWFSRYLRETIGITDSRMVFHSFRHTFKQLARDFGISTEVHHAITGHTMGNVGDNYGDIYYPLHPLTLAMSTYNIKAIINSSQ